MKSFTIILLLFFFASASIVSAQEPDLLLEIKQIEQGLLPGITVKGETSTSFNILERMEHYKVPGVSIAVVQDGKIKWSKGYGMANTNSDLPVNENTLFQAGSISKPVAALSVLKLVEEGMLDLDVDVNKYLIDWKVPTNDFTADEKVTLRRLLTHSAGMTVHGFPGYTQDDTFPSIIEVLSGAGNTSEIFVDTFPGSIWRYSGGGYTVMEKVVEDVSGQPFEEYMEEKILNPIGMINSTFEQPISKSYHSNASAAYDSDGKIIEGLWHNYPEQAAAGLWTTPNDLAKYCIEIQESLRGKPDGLLSQQSIEKMLSKHKNDWGLGPSLRWEGDSLIFGHGGKNAGFTNNMIAFANRGAAAIVMTNADNGGDLINEILRSISANYGWGISNPKEIELISLSSDQLSKFAGKYKLDFQVTGIGDYIVDVQVKDGGIYVDDSNNGETNFFRPMDEMRFIDLETGDEVMFSVNDDGQFFMWNSRFHFDKIVE